MAATITLTAVNGIEMKETHRFDHPSMWVLGRASDCDVCVPASMAYMDISRHHCRLEIDPPLVRVRDLGSRNGTFVNGVKIGQRHPSELPHSVSTDTAPGVELHTGDELRLGGLRFKVTIAADEKSSRRSHADVAGSALGTD